MPLSTSINHITNPAAQVYLNFYIFFGKGMSSLAD